MTQKSLIRYALIAALLLALPLVLQTFGNAWVRIADMALLYVLLAVGLNIVVGYAGLLTWVTSHFLRLALIAMACLTHRT